MGGAKAKIRKFVSFPLDRSDKICYNKNRYTIRVDKTKKVGFADFFRLSLLKNVTNVRSQERKEATGSSLS